MVLNGGATLDNYGEITGAASGITGYSFAPIITNYVSGTISGGWGIWFNSGGVILDNFGTVTGTLHAINVLFDGADIVNYALIDGHVVLSDFGANSVTLASGSMITGDLYIGMGAGSVLNFIGVPDPSLLYSVVNGDVDICGAAVGIDPAGIPAGLLPGDYMILIDGSTGTMTGAPANPTLAVGGYNFQIKVQGGQLIALLPVIIPTNYYITATADPGATISPSGTVSVSPGANKTFVFSAAEGKAISAVIVDGVPLSLADIGKGYYTFIDVHANHIIDVKSRDLRTDITLRIDVKEGDGYAEYSLNGGPFVRYTSVVSLPEFCTVDLRAFAESGKFSRWVDGSDVYLLPGISFSDVGASIYLELYFTDDNSSLLWTICLITLLIVAAIAVGWLIFFLLYRRSYDVVKIASAANIIGKDKARRKTAYHFYIEGGSSGTVSYKVGDGGEWKALSPGPDGDYTIPRKDVVDILTIECR
jgi:hypothetical protein